MIETLIALLVLLIILIIVYWIASLAITHFGGPPVILQIIGLILLLIFILAILGEVGGLPRWRFRP